MYSILKSCWGLTRYKLTGAPAAGRKGFPTTP